MAGSLPNITSPRGLSVGNRQLVIVLNKWNIKAQIDHKSNFNHVALYISNLNIETINLNIFVRNKNCPQKVLLI